MNYIIFISEIVGTIAFALSGALLAIKKDFDLLGITILGTVAAVGGGFMRDIILGATPPVMFSNYIYCAVAITVSLFACIPSVLRFLNHKGIYSATMILLDSIGLSVFTINGILYSANLYPDNVFLLFFTGVITGVGGGVIRDILACERPYIFTKHIYACASGAGAILYLCVRNTISEKVATLVGMVTILTIRMLAAHYRLELPHVKYKDT